MVVNLLNFEGARIIPYCLIQDGFSSLWDQTVIVNLLRKTVEDHNVQVVRPSSYILPVLWIRFLSQHSCFCVIHGSSSELVVLYSEV